MSKKKNILIDQNKIIKSPRNKVGSTVHWVSTEAEQFSCSRVICWSFECEYLLRGAAARRQDAAQTQLKRKTVANCWYAADPPRAFSLTGADGAADEH